MRQHWMPSNQEVGDRERWGIEMVHGIDSSLPEVIRVFVVRSIFSGKKVHQNPWYAINSYLLSELLDEGGGTRIPLCSCVNS